MRKYTDSPCDCYNCGKRNYFLVTIVQKDTKSYYLTKCPKCNTYDEVKNITNEEFESFRPPKEGKV